MNTTKTFRGKHGVWIVLALLIIACVAASVVLSGHLFRSTPDTNLTIDLIPTSEESAFRTLPLSQSSGSASSSDRAYSATLNAGSNAKTAQLNKRNYIIEDEYGTVWTTDTKVDIFKTSYQNARAEVTVAGSNKEKVIAPGTENTYTFSLHNNSSGYLDYKMTMNAFFAGLSDGKVIPVEVRVKSMNGWLLGDENTWAPVLELAYVEDSAVLEFAHSGVYTLEWRWPYESGDDAWDTWLGNHGEDITLTIQINTQSSYHSAEIPAITVPVPEWLNAKEHIAYIVGFPDGTVRPDANISRAEVVVILYRLLKDEVREEYKTDKCPFPDISEISWYRTAATTLANMGIIIGYPDGLFHGEDSITRGELATIFARLSKVKLENDFQTSFSDISDHWAKEEITQIEQFNWILGYGDGTFRPNNSITRAETITIVNRALHRMPEKVEDLLPNMHMWPDNQDPEKWYYIAIQEASHTHSFVRLRGTREKWTKILDIPALSHLVEPI